jgi:hypothetical protein
MRRLTILTALLLFAAFIGPPASAQRPTPTPAPHATLPAGLMAVPLARGCTNVVLTYPHGTAVADFHHAVLPASAPAGDVWTATPILEAIWRSDPATRRFLGWSPAPAAPNDFTTVDRLDAVFLCVREAGRLVQPALP